MAREIKEDTERKNLTKRGSVWYVKRMVDGKVIVQSTKQTALGKARIERDRILNPTYLRDEKERAEAVLERVQTVDRKLAKALDALPALTVKHAWDTFLNSPERSDAAEVTLDGYLCQWNRFEKWIEARRPNGELRAVTAKDAGDYAADLTAGKLSPNSFNKHVDLLKMIFKVLADGARLLSNPWDKIKRKRLSTQGRRAFNVQELQTILETAKGELQTLLIIGAYSGLRLGDAATLDWSAVDLAAGVITLRPKKTVSRTGKIVAVPIHRTLHDALSQTPETNRTGPVLPEWCGLYNTAPHTVAHRLQKHFRNCKIETSVPRIGAGKKRAAVAGFHALRHTIVSQLASKGVPLEVIGGIVGHGGESMTRAYVHQNAEAARAAVGTLQGIATTVDVPPDTADKPGVKMVAVLGQLEELTDDQLKAAAKKIREILKKRIPAK